MKTVIYRRKRHSFWKFRQDSPAKQICILPAICGVNQCFYPCRIRNNIIIGKNNQIATAALRAVFSALFFPGAFSTINLNGSDAEKD